MTPNQQKEGSNTNNKKRSTKKLKWKISKVKQLSISKSARIEENKSDDTVIVKRKHSNNKKNIDDDEPLSVYMD